MDMTEHRHASRVGRLVLGTGTILVGSGFSRVALLAVEFVLAGHLGSDGFGLYSIAFAIILLVSKLCLLGFNLGIIQYLAVYEEQRRADLQASLVRMSLAATLVFSCAAGAAIYIYAGDLATRIFAKPELALPLAVVALILPLETANQAMSAIFLGLRSYRRHIVVVDLARNWVLLGSIPFVLWLGLGVTEVLLVFLGGALVGTGIGLVALAPRLAAAVDLRRDWGVLATIFRFSYMLLLVDVMKLSTPRVFVIIGGMFLSAHDVGILAVAQRLVSVLNFPQTVIGRSAPAEFASLFHLGDRAGLVKLFHALCLAMAAVSFALILPMMVQPDVVMGLFGPEFAPYGWIVWPFIATKLINSSLGPVGQLLISMHRQRSVFVLSILELILLAPLIPAMYWYGLVGAIYAEVGRVAVLMVVRQLILVYSADIQYLSRSYLGLFVGGGVSILLGNVVAWQTGGMAGYAGGLAVATAGYLATLGGIAYVSRAELRVLRQALRRRPKRRTEAAHATLPAELS